MRILGIDPGMAIVGYCVLDVNCSDNSDISIVNCGSIQTDKNKSNAERLLEINEDLITIIETYRPNVASVEELFFFKNAKTIIPVAQARGVILMTLQQFLIQTFEYTPLVIKQTITGYGRATKQEVSEMVEVLLKGEKVPKLDDTADSIAIALCHLQHQV